MRPVGSNEEVPFQTRVVAASHRDLQEEVSARRFREDLLNRINVVQIDAIGSYSLQPARRSIQGFGVLCWYLMSKDREEKEYQNYVQQV